MIVSIEYDDGKPMDAEIDDRTKFCTPRGRRHGFYVRYPNGIERKLPIGFMRVSEMARLETVFNELAAQLT